VSRGGLPSGGSRPSATEFEGPPTRATGEIPGLPQAEVTPLQEKTGPLGSASKPTTILCVDDEPDTLTVLGWFLSKEGYIVMTASSGAEALLRMQERLPDFVITDDTMPGTTGQEMCRHLRAQNETRHIPIILYTALKLPADSPLYDRTLIKPTDLRVFACEIRALLAASH
jgi:CheY-like chemotaxis protein